MVEGDADRCPSDLPVVPMQLSMRDIVAMATMAGVECTDVSFQAQSISMQGDAGTNTSSRHPVLAALVHFAPKQHFEQSGMQALNGRIHPDWKHHEDDEGSGIKVSSSRAPKQDMEPVWLGAVALSGLLRHRHSVIIQDSSGAGEQGPIEVDHEFETRKPQRDPTTAGDFQATRRVQDGEWLFTSSNESNVNGNYEQTVKRESGKGALSTQALHQSSEAKLDGPDTASILTNEKLQEQYGSSEVESQHADEAKLGKTLDNSLPRKTGQRGDTGSDPDTSNSFMHNDRGRPMKTPVSVRTTLRPQHRHLSDKATGRPLSLSPSSDSIGDTGRRSRSQKEKKKARKGSNTNRRISVSSDEDLPRGRRRNSSLATTPSENRAQDNDLPLHKKTALADASVQMESTSPLQGAKRVRVLLPEEVVEDPPPLEVSPRSGSFSPQMKPVLRRPTEHFPEDPDFVRPSVASVDQARAGTAIPGGARWTKISRQLVSLEALELGRERFEEKEDYFVVSEF
ncbi:MAG: hypothetical protein Q9173_004331 [Seirophora scorigena]